MTANTFTPRAASEFMTDSFEDLTILNVYLSTTITGTVFPFGLV